MSAGRAPLPGAGAAPAPARPRTRAAAAALAAALALGAGCRSEPPPPPQAGAVDGRPIPLDALRRRVEQRLAEQPGAPLEEVASAELGQLIDAELVAGRARALGIEVGPDEAAERIRRLHGEGFQAPEGYAQQVQAEMLRERTALVELANQLQVSEPELRERFERTRARFERPARVRIRQILVADRASAEQLRAKLTAGADFAALAAERSLGPEARSGGLLPPFAAGELPEVFDPALALRPGQLSGILESPHGYHIFVGVERLPAQPAEFAALREELLGELRRERLAALRPDWLRGLRQQAQIAVNQRLLEDLR